MPLLRINKNPSGRQLGVFAAAWFVVAGVIALRLRAHGHPTASGVAAVAAVALPLAGAASRRVLRLAYLGLTYAAYPLGFVVSHVALALVYYLALTPIALTMRLLRYDPLARRFDPRAASYWKARGAPKSIDSYFKQS